MRSDAETRSQQEACLSVVEPGQLSSHELPAVAIAKYFAKSSPRPSIHWHVKFLASSASPCPVYCACLGYAQSGRLRPGNAGPVAITESGAIPFSTQFTTAESMSK